MKKIKFTMLVMLFFVIGYAEAEWIEPSRKMCIHNNGVLGREGTCDATWSQAKRICRQMNGRLPTYYELKGILKACGGKLNENAYNMKNTSYQWCYGRQGFSQSPYSGYWTSTSCEKNSHRAWMVGFYSGYSGCYLNGSQFTVRCIRGSR